MFQNDGKSPRNARFYARNCMNGGHSAQTDVVRKQGYVRTFDLPSEPSLVSMYFAKLSVVGRSLERIVCDREVAGTTLKGPF